MKRPIVIVDPISSGVELAPAFHARGVPAIAVTLEQEEWPEFGSRMRRTDFERVIPDQPGLEELIRSCDPIGIIPGTEEGIALAERLACAITPGRANDSRKASHRSHKALMQKALEEAGVPVLQTLHTPSEREAEEWIRGNGLEAAPLIVKPPVSSGSENVFHIPAGGDWRKAFRLILTEPSQVSGLRSEAAVVQEQAIGTEYAVGTVSADGKHYLAHLIRYNKTSSGERRTVFDHVEFVPFDEDALGELLDYTKRALDALGVRWGASHTEVMLTARGPRLIESSARLIGGPVVGFAREATGSSQADRLVEAYVDGDVQTKRFSFRKTVMPVFLKAPATGTISGLEAFESAGKLPCFLSSHLWVKNGDRVRQTVDYLTAFGIIALAGDRSAILADYRKIREMESKVVVTP